MSKLNSFISKWKDVEFIIAAIGIGLSLITSAITSIYTHLWDKNKFTAELLKEWNQDTKDFKSTIFTHYPKLANGSAGITGGMSQAESAALNNQPAEFKSKCATKNDRKGTECTAIASRVELRSATTSLLNYLNNIAIAYELDTVNNRQLQQALQGSFINYLGAFSEYIKSTNPQNSILYWHSFIRVGCKWNSEDSKPANIENHNAINHICEQLAAIERQTIPPCDFWSPRIQFR